MIFISKVLTELALPPGCFIIVLLLLFFFIPRKYKFFTGLITVIMYLLSIQPVSDSLLKPLEDAYPPLSANSVYRDADEINKNWPQAIVVLGSGTVQNSPEAGDGKDSLSSDAVKRAVYALTLRETYPVPVIYTGGKVFDYDQEPEADTAGRLFEFLRLPQEWFIAESRSRNTWENARETAKILPEREPGIKQAVLVTSAYHAKRSVYCFEKNGITVIPAPTDYKCQRGRKYDFLSYLPSNGSLNNSSLALHEYIGLLYYRLLYK